MKKKQLFIITFLFVTISVLFIFLWLNGHIFPVQPTTQPVNNHVTENTLGNEAIINDEFENKATTDDVPVIVQPNEQTLTFVPHIKIVAIGDSITEGVGDEKKNNGYVGILESTMNNGNQIVSFFNHGNSGDSTVDLLNRLKSKQIVNDIAKANSVLITIGANDIMGIFRENFFDLRVDDFASEENAYFGRLYDIISNVKQINPNASIYLIGFYNPFREFFADIPELEKIVTDWNNIGAEITTKFQNTYFIPIKDLFDENMINFLSADNFHLNHAGYERMAERIIQYLIAKEGELYEQVEITKR